eukprot:CAMPEP_0198260300 /NCGR_PEP_ID=MMETSP1447-20131203/9309_1 /TAXON_ID=420782 /ORGANISM="Chaetoceros dichaeta, Strain CCMP1751" /LENGTH=32 /DNA_ID= /DNA_START= /DNA_END= /DNA_ORIENTATION=
MTKMKHSRRESDGKKISQELLNADHALFLVYA